VRVALVNTYERAGGAARAAYRLYGALREDGVEATLVTVQSLPALPARLLMTADRVRRRIKLAPYSIQGGYEAFQVDDPWLGRLLHPYLGDSEVVNLHWVAGLLDFARLPQLAAKAPVVWTLHDMLAFTGGCHYDDSSEGFLRGCGSCPQLGSGSPHDLSRGAFERKRAAYAAVPAHRLHFVAPSQWLAREVTRSPLAGRFGVSVIPNSLELSVFRPGDRAEARATLGLPHDRFIVLFMAQDLVNRRKGMASLQAALSRLQGLPQVLLVSAGKTAGAADGPAVRHLGFVADDARLATLFRAADVFVLPSLQDNLPNTMLESLACGTPVVGFAVGGIPDLVRHGQSGLLAPPGDAGALAEAIRVMAGDPARARAMGARGRELVAAACAPAVQAAAYRMLFADMKGRA